MASCLVAILQEQRYYLFFFSNLICLLKTFAVYQVFFFSTSCFHLSSESLVMTIVAGTRFHQSYICRFSTEKRMFVEDRRRSQLVAGNDKKTYRPEKKK